MPATQIITTIVVSIFASTGFWAFVQQFMDRKSASREMLLGLGRDKLISKCHEYIDQGWIAVEELADLEKYLYTPYRKLGGNGTGEILFNKVNQLPNKEVRNEDEQQGI